MMRALVLAAALLAAAPAAAQTNRAPMAADVRQTSLYRADETWTVKSTVFLSATDPDTGGTEWTFELLNPEQLRDSTGRSRMVCTYADPANPGTPKRTVMPDEKMVTNALRVECEYQPPVGFVGEDAFRYQVTDNAETPATSVPATVTVDVKSQGLRWEFITSAGTALSSDSLQDPGGTIPDVIGRGTQDFTLGLDWLFRSPQYRITDRDGGIGKSSFAGHFAFRTGLITKTEVVQATPVATTIGQTLTTTAAEDALIGGRNFTAGSEVNYNWVLPATASGAYLELGGLARGHFDAALEGDEEFQEVAGRVLRLVRDGSGAFRGEAGGRIVLKQYHEATFVQTRQRGPSADIEYARNSDDLIMLEFGYQRDTSLEGAEALLSPNRYFLRVLATPVEIPGIPGHGKPMVGVEVTGGPGQQKQVKVLYGANISAIGRALGLGN